MPNYNLKVETQCPRCKQKRMARGDVVRKAERRGVELYCKPCRNQMRFEKKPHPTKGSGVKGDPALEYTRRSYYKAKRRCKLGAKHHPCYENVAFKIASLDELVAAIGLRPENQTLDRIDTNGDYEIGNIRWATRKQQAQNRNPRGTWSS